KIDTAKYHQWVLDLFQYWNNAGCKINTIEVGNEFAFSGFNGDFPVKPRGQGVIYDESYEWSDIPADIRTGIRKVGYLTKVTREAAHHKFGETRLPKVILGGLNAPYTDWNIHSGVSIMLP